MYSFYRLLKASFDIEPTWLLWVTWLSKCRQDLQVMWWWCCVRTKDKWFALHDCMLFLPQEPCFFQYREWTCYRSEQGLSIEENLSSSVFIMVGEVGKCAVNEIRNCSKRRNALLVWAIEFFFFGKWEQSSCDAGKLHQPDSSQVVINYVSHSLGPDLRPWSLICRHVEHFQLQLKSMEAVNCIYKEYVIVHNCILDILNWASKT